MRKPVLDLNVWPLNNLIKALDAYTCIALSHSGHIHVETMKAVQSVPK